MDGDIESELLHMIRLTVAGQGERVGANKISVEYEGGCYLMVTAGGTEQDF